MDARPLAMHIAGILLCLLSMAPEIFASTETPAERQTEFNDHNYQPSRQINISAPVTSTASRPKPERNKRIIQSNLEKIEWTNARGTTMQYRMYYEYDNTHITFASVCSNYRQGSIDYRNCRKAARHWFSAKCNNSSKSGRMYCHASNAFRP